MDGDSPGELEIRAFGLQFRHQSPALLKQFMHARITARALQLLLIDHDHRLVEHVVQLVSVERRGHALSVPQTRARSRALRCKEVARPRRMAR